MKSFFKFYNPTLNGVLQNLAHAGNKKFHQVPSKRGQAAGSGVPMNFVRRGVQQIPLRTGNREKGDLGAVAPSQGFWRQL